MIAISRCEDYRHDVWDVTAGSMLGILVAWLTYRRYYPNLRSRYCDTPYPSRSEMLKRFMRARDEEAAAVGVGAGRNGTAHREREHDEESIDEDDGLLGQRDGGGR